MPNPYAARIRNLIRRGNPKRAALQKAALIHLLKCQPAAVAIRFEDGKCPACRRTQMFLSYQLLEYDRPGYEHGKLSTRGEESCGYYCGACGWGNAGARKARKVANMLARNEGER